MSKLHPWLSTPEASAACEKAVEHAVKRAGIKALTLGRDELLSVARYLLTECAETVETANPTACAECGQPLEELRSGSLFCSSKCGTRNRVRAHRAAKKGEAVERVEHARLGHRGSMWTWPEDERYNYAIREVGMRLANHAVTEWTQSEASGTPASGWLYNADRDDDMGDGTDTGAAFDSPEDETPLANPEDRMNPLAFHVFSGPGYLKPSAEGLCEGEWHRRPAVENYYRHADRVLMGV